MTGLTVKIWPTWGDISAFKSHSSRSFAVVICFGLLITTRHHEGGLRRKSDMYVRFVPVSLPELFKLPGPSRPSEEQHFIVLKLTLNEKNKVQQLMRSFT